MPLILLPIDKKELIICESNGHLQIFNSDQMKMRNSFYLPKPHAINEVIKTKRKVNEYGFATKKGLYFVDLTSQGIEESNADPDVYLDEQELNTLFEFEKDKFIVCVKGDPIFYFVDRQKCSVQQMVNPKQL